MALTKAARSKILSFVQDAKRLLIKEVEEQLQQYYGIRPDGTVLMIEQLTTAESEIIYTARLLRQRLEYLKANLADEKNQEVEAVRQLVREQAFTILNRFASLRMAEERGIIKETIRKEYNSEGFQVFDSITGQGQTAPQYTRYKWYLYAIFDELALDLPAVFDRYSPYALIFPSEQAMNKLLDIINNEGVTLHREEGLQPVNLWKEDETIGWVYQYYNSREEISAMREASGAPRNSQELAVRNQFFTPRYVVQFLTDNSLGRIWYEMTQGNTVLKTVCPYLIIRPNEVFLKKGETKPEKADEETQYIDYRPLKDPREILMLDPACGSMHFGLYTFDLMEYIYVEAWDNYPDLLTDLRNSMTRQAFVQQIPEFIIRYNIHGVDIDPRALQIAGLSLWLRAQKSFDKQNLPANQRPQITRSNLVLAEPMPGSVETLSQLVQPLESPMRKLVLRIWEQMKLAGELGLLLRIEEEIDNIIQEIAQELADENRNTQLTLGGEDGELQAAEKAALYATKKYRDSFLDSAEMEVLKILKQLSETATNGDAYQKLLFADDTARGFAFIELCRKKYDVVVMNPPFGDTSVNTKKYIAYKYSLSKDDLAAVFLDRMIELGHANFRLGCISTRTIFFLGSFDEWRNQNFPSRIQSKAFADFGDKVLEATVETAAYILSKNFTNQYSPFFRLLISDDKSSDLLRLIHAYQNNKNEKNLYINSEDHTIHYPGKPFAYWMPKSTFSKLKKFELLEGNIGSVRVGLQTGEDFRYLRNYWEVKSEDIFTDDIIKYNNKKWAFYTKTDFASPFFSPITAVVNWENNGKELESFFDKNGKPRSALRSKEFYGKPGISYMLRSTRIVPYASPANCIPTAGRSQIYPIKDDDVLKLFSFCSSSIFSSLARLKGEQFARPKFQAGIIQTIPTPKLDKLNDDLINKEVNTRYKQEQYKYHSQEPYLEFIVPAMFLNKAELKNTNSIKGLISSNIEDQIIDLYNLTDKEKASINIDLEEALSIRSSNEEEEIIKTDNEEVIRLMQYLLGVYFSRYDIRMCWDIEKRPTPLNIFERLMPAPLGSIFEKDKLSHDDLKYVRDYFVCQNSNQINNSVKQIACYLDILSQKGFPDLEAKIIQDLNIDSITNVFTNPNLLFDFHLKNYSAGKRISPIYWPISTASGSYTIWIYYPKLNDQSLYKIVSDYIIPKKEEVTDEIKKLELNASLDNNGKKQLLDLQDLLHELQVMEKELIEVAELPYKPNHDDGVLITAAPLHKFFRHSKWRKATEDCWKALQKGEYDWAHLAYSIWPDRVTKKCKKDLSMAIAHGLEGICEVKPKEKKAKKAAKPPKNATQQKLID